MRGRPREGSRVWAFPQDPGPAQSLDPSRGRRDELEPMRDRIAGKRAHNGLGILDLAVEHRIDQLGQRHQVHIHELIVVGIRAAEFETRRHVDMDDLVAKTGSRGDGGEVLAATGGEPLEPMRDRIAGKRAHNGLGILDLAVEHRIDQLGQRHQVHIHELIVVGIRAAEFETRRHVDMDDLVAKTGSRGDGGEVLAATGGEPCLFEHFALRAN